jgi:hypothetical protein
MWQARERVPHPSEPPVPDVYFHVEGVLRRAILRDKHSMLTLSILVRWSVFTTALIVVLLGAAGESSVALWLYVVLWSALILVTSFTVDPDLIRERRRPGPGRQGSLLLAGLFTASIAVSHLIIAGLDVGRFH